MGQIIRYSVNGFEPKDYLITDRLPEPGEFFVNGDSRRVYKAHSILRGDVHTEHGTVCYQAKALVPVEVS